MRLTSLPRYDVLVSSSRFPIDMLKDTWCLEPLLHTTLVKQKNLPSSISRCPSISRNNLEAKTSKLVVEAPIYDDTRCKIGDRGKMRETHFWVVRSDLAPSLHFVNGTH